MAIRLLCIFLTTFSLPAYAAKTLTYEQAMQRKTDDPYVHEIAVAEYEYHYGNLYGRHIWSGTQTVGIGDPAEGQISLPDLDETFALFDTVTLGPEAGFKTLLLGMGGCVKRDCNIRKAKINGYNKGLSETATPNVAYYRYTHHRNAAQDDQLLKPVFDEALALFRTLFDAGTGCRLNGWTETRQYRSVKGVIYKPGQRYRHGFRCTSEYSDKGLGVEVGAILLNDGDVGVFAYISTRCELPIYDKRKKAVSDLTVCGFRRAKAHQAIFDQHDKWIQVAIGPNAQDPSVMEMHTRYRQGQRIDPTPSPLREDLIEKIRADDASEH